MMILRSFFSNKNCLGTPLLESLIFERRLPWRYREFGFRNNLINNFIIHTHGKFNRFILPYKKDVKKNLSNSREDITVVIGVKNRYDHKIENSLKSIREQDYPQDLIKIIIVDYGSKKKYLSKLKRLCKKYNAEPIIVGKDLPWNRSHCLNIGIKRAKTKYLMASDTDIIFRKDYFLKSIKEISKKPFSIILSQCLDLQESFGKRSDIKRMLKFSKPRSNLSAGISMGLTYFYQKIKGFDEKYKLYGLEDDDLIKRFHMIGLKIKDLSNESSYYHQWHPKHEGVKSKKLLNQINLNREYFLKNKTIKRNDNGWGELD